MPIKDLQRRHVEIGRIRLGEKQEFRRQDGSTGTKPVKLATFRFTSPHRHLIEAIATLYGGTARPWDNGGKPEFEVTTPASSIPVIVVKGGLTQWMEFWSAGGCIHRCDGETNVLTDSPCDLRERVQVGRKSVNPHAEARPTTRLSVMLRDVESLGVWRMESHGWNAAVEIPAMAELAMFVGDLVPATLHLVERRTIKDGETSRFVVPVLDLAISKQRLVEIVGAQTGGAPMQIDGMQQAPAIAAAPDYPAMLAQAGSIEDCQAIWHRAGNAGHLDDALKAAITARGKEIQAQEAQQLPPAPPNEGEDDAEGFTLSMEQQGDGAAAKSAASIWMQVVAEAGEHGWSTSDLADAFDVENPGVAVADASAWALEDFLAKLRAGQIERSAA